jgi:hypothetical protein
MDTQIGGLLLIMCSVTFAQSVVESAGVDVARALMDKAGAMPKLRCEFTSIRPDLTYGLHFRTGYRVQVPLNQFSGSGLDVSVLLRVTPDGGIPTYLASVVRTPVPADRSLAGVFEGSFLVGEGAYKVEAMVADEANRGCSERWQIHAKRKGVERELKAASRPGSVAADRLTDRDNANLGEARVASHPTILLHAAPLKPGGSVLSTEDISMLAGSLSAVLRQLSVESARVIVFNLNLGKVLQDKEDFTATDLRDLAVSLKGLQLGVVDYRALRNPNHASEFLTSLLGDLRMTDSDVLLWLGSYFPAQRGLQIEKLKRITAAGIFYLEYRQALCFNIPSPERGYYALTEPDPQISEQLRAFEPSRDADNIEELVHRMQGETLVLRTPHDLAKAIRRIEQRVKATNAGSN